MSGYYHLILSVDSSFQKCIDVAQARLTEIHPRKNNNGKLLHLKSSKKRIAHSGSMMLDELSLEHLIELSRTVKVIDQKDAPYIQPKHTAVQMDKKFLRFAQLKSLSAEIRFSLESNSRQMLHYGIVALSSAPDNLFEDVAYNSLAVEEDRAPIHRYDFYDIKPAG